MLFVFGVNIYYYYLFFMMNDMIFFINFFDGCFNFYVFFGNIINLILYYLDIFLVIKLNF